LDALVRRQRQASGDLSIVVFVSRAGCSHFDTCKCTDWESYYTI